MSKAIIIIILIWLAMIGAVVFLIVPQAQECLSAVNINNQKQTELTELEKLMSKFETLKQDYFDHLDLAEKVQGALPSQEEIPELISEMTALASKNALLITNLGFNVGGQTSQASSAQSAASDNTGGGMPAPTITEGGSVANPDSLAAASRSFISRLVTINLSLKGSYDNFKAFLKDAEKDLRILDLRNLNLNPGQGDEQKTSSSEAYSFDLEFETYFLPQWK